MAVSRLFKQIVLGGVALAVIGSGLFTVRLLAEEKAQQMVVEVYQVADLPVWKVTRGTPPEYDGTLLLAHIRQAAGIGPDDEGSIEEHPSTASLVIRQTRAKHQKISGLLEQIREDQKLVQLKATLDQANQKSKGPFDATTRSALKDYEKAKAHKEARRAAESN